MFLCRLNQQPCEDLWQPSRSVYEQTPAKYLQVQRGEISDEGFKEVATEVSEVPDSGVREFRKRVTETLAKKVQRLEERLEASEKDNSSLHEQLREKDDEIEILSELATIDGLTRLYNRKYFDDHLTIQIQESMRHKRDLSLVFIDLDKFKLLNDGMGHLVGDEALRIVSGIIRDVIRPNDIECRFGGEELVIILPETNKENAGIAAERLRKTIEEKLRPLIMTNCVESETDEGNRRMLEASLKDQLCTASIGVCTYDIASSQEGKTSYGDSIEDIIKTMMSQADACLYRAKEEGRNRVVIHGEGQEKVQKGDPDEERAIDHTLKNKRIDDYEIGFPELTKNLPPKEKIRLLERMLAKMKEDPQNQ